MLVDILVKSQYVDICIVSRLEAEMTLHEMSSRIRGRREELELSQAEVAAKARVSRAWLNAFERGKPSVEIGPVLRILDALGLCLEVHECEANPSRLDAILQSHQ